MAAIDRGMVAPAGARTYLGTIRSRRGGTPSGAGYQGLKSLCQHNTSKQDINGEREGGVAGLTEKKDGTIVNAKKGLGRRGRVHGINSVLYQRGIYPPESFIPVEQFDLTLLTSFDERVKVYLNKVLGQIEGNYGIPQSQSKLVETLVISIGKALDVDISQADIYACHRLRSPAGKEYPSTIVCKFFRRTTKEDLR
uniref:HORMA domain-containing protein n=1 Tax=Timema cristinae TaxID=61476 RepID=A0A7R9CEN6_TIMCR|nr:unnamed protein product [Timema cristinae]